MKWSYKAGFVIGIASLTEIIIWVLSNYEGGTLGALIALSIFLIPFLTGIIIAWKMPLFGGLIIIGIVVIWLISDIIPILVSQTTQPILSLLRVELILPIFFPQLVTGVLFLLSWKTGRKKDSK